MATLIANVVVGDVWYGPAYGNADDVPAEVARQIPNPKAWHDGELPDGPTVSGAEPPRHGRGSGVAAWRAYAEGQGIEVRDDADRDDIVALVDGHRAEQD
jgi:hypothetical protein